MKRYLFLQVEGAECEPRTVPSTVRPLSIIEHVRQRERVDVQPPLRHEQVDLTDRTVLGRVTRDDTRDDDRSSRGHRLLAQTSLERVVRSAVAISPMVASLLPRPLDGSDASDNRIPIRDEPPILMRLVQLIASEPQADTTTESEVEAPAQAATLPTRVGAQRRNSNENRFAPIVFSEPSVSTARNVPTHDAHTVSTVVSVIQSTNSPTLANPSMVSPSSSFFIAGESPDRIVPTIEVPSTDSEEPLVEIVPVGPVEQSPPSVIDQLIEDYVPMAVPLLGAITDTAATIETHTLRLLSQLAGDRDEAEADWIDETVWWVSAVLVAGGVGYSVGWNRGRKRLDRMTLGTDSVIAEWESEHVVGTLR